eukprot:XP_001692318.1 predicted protein [Chlamydomonas reinhardtii]
MADHMSSAFGQAAQAPLGGTGADLPLSPQWRQPFGRATSMEPPMKSALIGPWDGNAGGAQGKDAAAASKAPAAWRGPEGPPNRDAKWPDKDRPDYNAARDRPAPTRWREREEDPRDRTNWENDRQARNQLLGYLSLNSDRFILSMATIAVQIAGATLPVARVPVDRWGERKPNMPLGEREWLPGMPPESDLPKRPDRWGGEGAERRPAGGDERWRAPGAAGGGTPEAGFTSTQAGRGRGFATGRGRGLKPAGPTAPGSGVPDRWDAPNRGVERVDSGLQGGGSQGGTRRYSSPQMQKIFNSLLSASPDHKLPTPRINPEVGRSRAGGNSGPTSSAPSGSGGGGLPAAPPGLPTFINHELFVQDKWVYKDPQGQTQGPFGRSDIMEWLQFGYFGEDLPIRAGALDAGSPDPRPFGSAARYEPVSNRTDTSSHAPSFGDWQDSSAAASAASAAASAASAALPTLLGRKLAEPTPGVAGSPGQPGAMAGAAAADAAAQPGSARPFTLDPPVQLHTAGSGGMGPGGLGALGGLGGKLSPAPATTAQPKAWGGAAAKPPPVTNLRTVLYEESAADLEGGAADEDLADDEGLFWDYGPAAATPRGGWASAVGVANAAPAPVPSWCRGKMVEFFGNDDLTLVAFLYSSCTSRSEVADYCQEYMRGKPNVSTFVAEFLKRKDADVAARSKASKGKGGAAGAGKAGPAAAAPAGKAAAATGRKQARYLRAGAGGTGAASARAPELGPKARWPLNFPVAG